MAMRLSDSRALSSIRSGLERFFSSPPGIDSRFYQSIMLVCVLGVPFHASFILLFALLGIYPMALFNVSSVAFWLLAIFFLRRAQPVIAASLISAEVMAHAILSVHYIGWQTGFQQYLIPVAVSAFILPGRRLLSTLTAAFCTAIYILLYFYDGINPHPVSMSDTVFTLLYILNTTTALLLATLTVAYYTSRLELAEAALQVEHKKSEDLLHNILPGVIADRLKQSDATIADGFASASVLFADIADFTPLSQRMKPERVVQLLNDIFSRFDELVAKYGLEKIKTVGDAYMVASGIPVARADHADAIARLAYDMQCATADFNREHGMNLQVRIGINSGPVVAGVIGKSRFLYDLWGDAVNTASRMESHGVPGEIQVTEATRNLLGDTFTFEERGMIEVKGKGPMRAFLLRRTPTTN